MTVKWRERTPKGVNGTDEPFTKRQWFFKLRYWFFGWAIATLLCTIIGPFDSNTLTLFPRFLYWAGWNGFTVLLMMGLIGLTFKFGLSQFWQIGLAASFIFSIIYSFAWAMINPRLFSNYSVSYLETWIEVFLISLTVFALIYVTLPKTKTTSTAPALSLKLEKYPNAKIFALHAQDHYVEVITDHGTELLRMSLADAIKEMKGCDGLQVHRSYWVSRQAIKKIDRKNLIISLYDGSSIPMSRRRIQDVRNFVQSTG